MVQQKKQRVKNEKEGQQKLAFIGFFLFLLRGVDPEGQRSP